MLFRTHKMLIIASPVLIIRVFEHPVSPDDQPSPGEQKQYED